jgi:hypothetical protein
MRRSCVLLAATMLVTGAGCGDDEPEASPPKHRVTAQEIKGSLERSGLDIHWIPSKPGKGAEAVLVGEATRQGRYPVGFEFALSRDARATDDLVGRGLAPPHHPWRANPATDDGDEDLREKPRGVIANVAYANFYYGRKQPAGTGDVQRRIDDALFGVFPRDDPEAFPILNRPP